MTREVLQAFDSLPLAAVLRALQLGRLERCPRAACRSAEVVVISGGWACLDCGALGGGGALAAAYLEGLDFDQVAEVRGG